MNPAVGAARGGSPVPNAELSKRVAQKIASTIDGAKAGEDWWFTGWRVEGQDRRWNLIVESNDGAVTLEGEVPSTSMARKAVGAALQAQGVQSVRSDLEIEPVYARYYPYHAYHPYGYGYGMPYAYGVGVPYAAGDARTQGQHTMTGKVTDIDKQKGTVTLQTDQGSVDLRFPPASLKGVAEGEKITVELWLVK